MNDLPNNRCRPTPITVNPGMWIGPLIFLACAITFLHPMPGSAQIQPQPATAPRSRQIIDLTQVNENWARDWEVTHTAAVFPNGGHAGFYRRPPRMGDAIPHSGRLGILYLYPESDYRPAKIVRRYVPIDQSTSRLVVSASANRIPRGEWFLRVLVDGRQLGEKVQISGQDGWQDIAFNLSGFLNQRVDLEIECSASSRRAAHVYIDSISFEDPSTRPVSSLLESGSNLPAYLRVPSEQAVKEPWEVSDDELYFDIFYWNFIELLRDREERRRYDYDFYYDRNKTRSWPKRP